jgi:hypothetical protein
VLIVLHYEQVPYEINRLVVQKWAYGERIFSMAFLAMMLGMVVGWWNHRLAAVLILSGWVLTTATVFVSRFGRPMLGADPQAVAVSLLPFFVVGALYAYSGRRHRSIL